MASHDALLSRRYGLRSERFGTSLRRLLPSQSPTLRNVSYRSYRSTGKEGFQIQAVAAPEKSTASEEPFTAWGTAQQRVPKREDLKTIMILGAGPIIIGQVSD